MKKPTVPSPQPLRPPGQPQQAPSKGGLFKGLFKYVSNGINQQFSSHESVSCVLYRKSGKASQPAAAVPTQVSVTMQLLQGISTRHRPLLD